MLVGVILHVTVLAIVGYLLLYTAGKAQGITALIGRLLGLWVFALAILSLAAVATAPMFGGKPFGMEMMRGHGPGWMHHWGHDGSPDQHMMPAPPAEVTPPAAPAQPAPPKP